jgi:hypothetical protein
MTLATALDFIHSSTIKQLRELSRERLVELMSGLTPAEIETFMFEKNINIFGGINGYANDMFKQKVVEKVLQFPVQQRLGLVSIFRHMLTYENLTKTNEKRITKALTKLITAKGGRRTRKRQSRRN